jgi:hypothetical protein
VKWSLSHHYLFKGMMDENSQNEQGRALRNKRKRMHKHLSRNGFSDPLGAIRGLATALYHLLVLNRRFCR